MATANAPAPKLVVAPVKHGTSASSWVPAARSGHTLADHDKAVTGTYLADPRLQHAVVADLATMGHRGWALLTDEGTWGERPPASVPGSPTLVGAPVGAFRAALVGAGIDPPRGASLASGAPARPPGHGRGQGAPAPGRGGRPARVFVPDSLSEDERYELWHGRRGPNAEVVAAIGAEAAAGYQPTISVLMPVCDTEAWMLEAAVRFGCRPGLPELGAVRRRRRLVRAETLAALESIARRDSRVG